MESRSIWHFIFMLIVSQQGISGDEIRLDQSPAVIKRPRETVKISCKISGFTMTSYWMHWIRQKPGKALEWIGRVNSGSVIYADSVKNHFTLSEDVSQSTQYLEAKSLREEDAAVYYCARHEDAFDYWGKGTMVTVSSDLDAKVIPPVVFPMSLCKSSSDSLILGCLASGFSPAESVRFKWMDQSGNSLTDFIEHPTVKTGDKMLKVSYINITKEKWDQSKIMCTAEHSLKNVTESFSKVPTLSLVHVPTQKSTSVMCVIEDFYPGNFSVQWKVNDVNNPTQSKLVHKLNEDTGFYTAYSFYKVSSKTWNANNFYTCEVTHNQGKMIHVTNNFEAKLKLILKPPNQEQLFVYNKTVLEVVVSGDVQKTVQEASVSCKVKTATHHVTINVENKGVVFSNAFSQFVRIENITVDTDKWFNGDNVTCTIRDNNNKEIEQEIHFDKGDGKTPSVFIYKPANTITGPVSLVCEVTSPKLGDVYLMWKVGEEPYKEGRTSASFLREDSRSVLSILTVSKQQYENPKTTITCAVMLANMRNINAPLKVTTSSSKQSECPADY